jgi:hypothetical protein
MCRCSGFHWLWWSARRQGNADPSEYGADTAGSDGTKAKPPSGLIDVGLNDLIEVAEAPSTCCRWNREKRDGLSDGYRQA